MTSRNKRHDRDGIFAGNRPERAIIDIGSNTVRLVIYGGSMRAPTVLLNEKVTARLGSELAATGRLGEESVELAMRALKRFVLLLDDLEVADVECVATAAVREAANGGEFVEALRSLSLRPRVISGEEEGRLSAMGVAGAFPGASGIVADLGGGSLELVRLSGDETHDAASLPLGTLRLPDFRKDDQVGGGSKDVRADMRKALEKALRKAGWDAGSFSEKDARTLYLVGGTWRAMAVFAMQEQGHPLSDPHGFELSPGEAETLAKRLAAQYPEDLKPRERISSMRAEKLPDAAVLLLALIGQLEPERLVFSSWGLREGLLYDRLAPHARAQDPLLAGISVFATLRGAPPPLAARVAAWTVDAAPARRHGSERLRLTATQLALASMQIEPNIRLPQAIDWALHKRWIAVGGKERAMMAAAIAANGNRTDLPQEVHDLASDEAIAEAQVWGFATRLARRLGARSRRSLQVSRLLVEEGTLVLRLAESHAHLFGVPTEKDMKLLAGAKGLDWRVDIVPDEALRNDE
ncbi:Ppx/GppA family phosphatase [Erythrobacter sp.]|jgi:exopolyphosphatase/guanosine-5'-triphosphate,3'-diphosphate pyrophosphatase|uniref:Ppx/GppA family phosphatase n=1 Tax=Erythrobacter sp. TaxID=1042 RepID=UPI002ECAD5EF|nr:Ppx/GppA family phosphatase [Erythrobacter sp.]